MDRRAAEIPRIDVEAYRAQGFVLVRGVFDRDTIAQMRAEADPMLERVLAAGRNVEATWQGSWREELIGNPLPARSPSFHFVALRTFTACSAGSL